MFKLPNKNILKILTSVVFIMLLNLPAYSARDKRFVSISPAMTEIMYAIRADSMLFGVSDYCKYPKEALQKEKIGSGYSLNEEKIIKIKPDYILALDSSSFMLNKFKRLKIEPLCFKYPKIESIYDNILTLGKLTGKENRAKEVVDFSKKKIEEARKSNTSPGKKILYLMQARPMITAGKESFISDIIEKSGNKIVTESLNGGYPVILEEYAILLKPDVVVLSYYCNENEVKKFFPNTRVVRMTKEETDIINRPGPRIYQAVEFFAKL